MRARVVGVQHTATSASKKTCLGTGCDCSSQSFHAFLQFYAGRCFATQSSGVATVAIRARRDSNVAPAIGGARAFLRRSPLEIFTRHASYPSQKQRRDSHGSRGGAGRTRGRTAQS
jgi:hypothetical protein